MSNEAVDAFDLDFLNNIYLPKRIKHKIWVRAILPDVPNMRPYRGRDATSLRTSKVMDHARFPISIEVNLYGGHKVAFMSFAEQVGLIIESCKIHDTLVSIFEQQWEGLG